MREDENINTDGSPTVNIEIMTNQNEVAETEEVKTSLKTSSSLEEVEITSTKPRGKRDQNE